VTTAQPSSSASTAPADAGGSDRIPLVACHEMSVQYAIHYHFSDSFKDSMFHAIRSAGRGLKAAVKGGDQDVIEAPMPGLVKQVTAKPGQEVREGDRLAVLEAMKMEHSLLAARDGTVEEVLVVEGAQVAAGAALIRLASGESERSSA